MKSSPQRRKSCSLIPLLWPLVAAFLLVGCVDPEGAESDGGEDVEALQTAEQALSSAATPPPLPTSAEIPELMQPWDSPQYAHLKPADEVLAALALEVKAAPPADLALIQKQNDFLVAWNKEATVLRRAGVTREALDVERALFKERFFADVP